MFHIPLMTYAVHAERLGYEIPEQSISMTPNVAKPRSRGRLWLTSTDPDEQPAIDFGYLTDEDGYDEWMLLAGLHAAREIAATEPMAGWVGREVFPGPAVPDDDLPALVRGRTTPSTTAAGRAGWARTTTRSPCSTPSCGCAGCAACGWPTRPRSPR